MRVLTSFFTTTLRYKHSIFYLYQFREQILEGKLQLYAVLTWFQPGNISKMIVKRQKQSPGAVLSKKGVLKHFAKCQGLFFNQAAGLRPEVFCRKAILKNFTIFTEKHSLFRDSNTGVFL